MHRMATPSHKLLGGMQSSFSFHSELFSFTSSGKVWRARTTVMGDNFLLSEEEEMLQASDAILVMRKGELAPHRPKFVSTTEP